MTSKSIFRVVLVSAFILLVPLLAMQVGDEVNWGLGDFVIAGALLIATGLAFELVASKVPNIAYRAAVGLALAGALLLVWMSLAVGIIGVDGDPADLMYGGVIAVGVVGAFMAQFQPRGMARALLAAAAVQALVAMVAVLLGRHQAEASSLAQVVTLNGFFVALFVGSAWLFLRAAQSPRANSSSHA